MMFPTLSSARFDVYDMSTDSRKLVMLIVAIHLTLTALPFCFCFVFFFGFPVSLSK
jgi:hypothetical protein